MELEEASRSHESFHTPFVGSLSFDMANIIASASALENILNTRTRRKSLNHRAQLHEVGV
jgi:hypothetical protein